MKRLRAGSALLIAAMVAAASLAQTNEQLQKQFNELQASVRRLEAENAALKSQGAPEEPRLETEINRLSERMGSATNLRSCASQVKLGGEFRYRGYYGDIHNNATVVTDGGLAGIPNDGSGTWADARIRLNFQYDFGCDVTAFAELQSRFAFGESTDGPFFDWNHTRPDEVPGAVGMYQAWLEFRDIFCNRNLSARVGRQEIVFGNQFQLGNADWYNGIVHDGLRVDWRANCWSLTGLAVKLTTLDGDVNQLPSYFTSHDDDELYGAYFTIHPNKCLSIDAYWLYVNGHGGFAENSGASYFTSPGLEVLYPLSNAYFHTLGARVGGTFNVLCGLDYNVEGAVQTGTTHTTGFEEDVDGVSVEAEVGLTFSRRNKIRVFARGLFAEGPKFNDQGLPTSPGYLILYPNRHSNTGFRARYGLADLMPMTNVESIQLGAHFDPGCNWTVGATGLWAQTEAGYAGAGISNEYGTELDIWAEYRYSPLITIGAGVGLVAPGDSGEILWGMDDSTQFIGYLQARLAF